MKRILVTGGAGFIGSHTVVELAAAGCYPVIIDNFSNSEESVMDNIAKITGNSIQHYKGDYQNPALLAEVFNSQSINGVIHFAAFKAVGDSVQNPLKYYENNVAGLVTLLKACIEHRIANFVFSSSCTVYGQPDSLPVTEDAPLKPAISPYGSTKQFCETIIRDATSAGDYLRSVSLRYFNPIGAHPSGLIGELPKGVPANLVPFITQAAAGIRDKIVVYGNDYPTTDGTCIRDYIHVVDLAKAHVKALEYLDGQNAGFYDTFNIGTGRGSSVMEVINTFEKVNYVSVPYEIGPRREGDVIETYASAEKANTVLGWRAEKSLEDSLKDAWNWQLSLQN